MKKTITAIQSLAKRWYKHQYNTPIDSDYITKNIIYKYAYLEYLKDKKVPFYIFASIAYHYFKLGKINKVEELYLDFINKTRQPQQIDSSRNIVIKKSSNPKGFDRLIDITKEKKEKNIEVRFSFNPKDTEFKLLKGFFVLSFAIDSLITNNKINEQRDLNSNFLVDYKKAIEKKLTKKIVIDTINNEIEHIGDIETPNKFNKQAKLDEMIKFFSVFKGKNEKNKDKQWLDENQFNKFIEKAFHGNVIVEKQKFHQGKFEKYFIVKRFVQLYESHIKLKLAEKSDKDKYIKLLTDNFVGWDFEDISANFKSTIVKRSWEMY